MELLNSYFNYPALTVVALAAFAFVAGFIDAAAGGGGLVQLPALLINLPGQTIPTIFGTNKMASFAGTCVAIHQYSKKIKYNFRLLAVVAFFAFVASRLGAQSVFLINVDKLKPLILVLLIAVATYVFFNKNLGKIKGKDVPLSKQMLLGSLIGFAVGFYDGFFGPGAGSFLVLGFVLVLGFEFVAASAYSKVINGVTNISAIIVFASKGNFLLEIAIPMAICNAAGSIVGSRMTLHRGNSFVRVVLLVVVSLMIARYAYEVFWQ